MSADEILPGYDRPLTEAEQRGYDEPQVTPFIRRVFSRTPEAQRRMLVFVISEGGHISVQSRASAVQHYRDSDLPDIARQIQRYGAQLMRGESLVMSLSFSTPHFAAMSHTTTRILA